VTDTRSERLLWPHGNPGATIYGTLVAAALLATEAAGSATVLAMVGTILGTLIVYWLAHVYADVIARQALSEGEDPHRLTMRIVVEALTQELGVIIGGALLVVVLVVVDLAGAGRSAAVDAAQLCSIAQLVAWGVFAARRAHLRPVSVVLYALVSAALGVLIGLLKVALH
jgi:membrane protein YqaA with SNARE-associated domain